MKFSLFASTSLDIFTINTFSVVSDHSINDKKNNQIELDILKNKRAIIFKKKKNFLFVIFAIAASAWVVDRRNGCTGVGTNGLRGQGNENTPGRLMKTEKDQ